jgi:hypothetical protein
MAVYLEVGLVNCVLVLFLGFKGNSILLSMMAIMESVYKTVSSVQKFSFLHILVTSCYHLRIQRRFLEVADTFIILSVVMVAQMYAYIQSPKVVYIDSVQFLVCQ